MVAARARELPADEREQERDRDSREPKVGPRSSPPNPDGRRGLKLLLLREAAVVLVDERLRVEPEVVRVGAEKSLREGRPGEDVEPLLLERVGFANSVVVDLQGDRPGSLGGRLADRVAIVQARCRCQKFTRDLATEFLGPTP
jgi:hypothetical protein